MTLLERIVGRGILAAIFFVLTAITFAGQTLMTPSALASPHQPQNERTFNTSVALEVELRELGFISFTLMEDRDGVVRVGGEKIGGEAVALSIHASIDGGPWAPAGGQGTATYRLGDSVFGDVRSGSKLTLASGQDTRFDMSFVPLADTVDAKYSVNIASAEQESWLWSVPVPVETPAQNDILYAQ